MSDPTTTLAAPSGVTGTIKTEWGNFPIEDGVATVDARAVPALLTAGFVPSTPDAVTERLLPAGSTTGQVLEKASADDFDATWATP